MQDIKYIIGSEARNTSVTVFVPNKALWAVIALFFLRIILGSNWTGYTIFPVPKRKVLRTNAFVCITFVDHLNFFDYFALTLVSGWVHSSWGFTFETFTSSSNCAVSLVGWTRLALWVNRIENIRGCAFHAIIQNFIESLWTTCLKLILIPTRIWIGKGFRSCWSTLASLYCLLWKDTS